MTLSRTDNNEMGECLAKLYDLANLPPNTPAHQNRNGYFIPNGGKYSSFPLVSRFSNKIKGHTPPKTAQQIETFFDQLGAKIKEDFSLKNKSEQQFRRLLRINRQIHQAVHGKHPKGGLHGLMVTYGVSSEASEKIKTSIQKIQTVAMGVLQKSTNLNDKPLKNLIQGEKETTYTKLPYCPEDHFNNQEWMREIQEGHLLRKEPVTMGKYYLKYGVGLGFNKFMNRLAQLMKKGNWNWVDEIFEAKKESAKGVKFFLSAIPLHNKKNPKKRSDLVDFQNKGIKAVLSVTEVFENKDTKGSVVPVTPEQWEKAGILQFQLPTADFATISIQDIQRGVAFLRWCELKGYSVDIHCKAGRGRSALILMCYLMQHHGMTAEKAFDTVRGNRPQSGFSGRNPGEKKDAKWTTLKIFERLVQASKLEE